MNSSFIFYFFFDFFHFYSMGIHICTMIWTIPSSMQKYSNFIFFKTVLTLIWLTKLCWQSIKSIKTANRTKNLNKIVRIWIKFTYFSTLFKLGICLIYRKKLVALPTWIFGTFTFSLSSTFLPSGDRIKVKICSILVYISKKATFSLLILLFFPWLFNVVKFYFFIRFYTRLFFFRFSLISPCI